MYRTDDLEQISNKWQERYSELKVFKKKFGHCNVPNLYSDNPKLAIWVKTQRVAWRGRKLSREKMRALSAIGFICNLKVSTLDRLFDDLLDFRSKFGHCDVPKDYPDNPKLASWVLRLRMRQKRGKLKVEEKSYLTILGFDWDPRETNWHLMFDDLKEFQTAHGHCDVPEEYSVNPKLFHWITRQKSALTQGSLSEDRILKLDAIDFIWDKMKYRKSTAIVRVRTSCYEEKWNKLFEDLKEFQKAHGHCDVPKEYSVNPKFFNWVTTQRGLSKKNTLQEARRLKLDAVGFIWDKAKYNKSTVNIPARTNHRAEQWNKMFEELKGFQKEHGHCDVSKEYPVNHKLFTWATTQRSLSKKNTLQEARRLKLDAIDIIWDIRKYRKNKQDPGRYKNIKILERFTLPVFISDSTAYRFAIMSISSLKRLKLNPLKTN